MPTVTIEDAQARLQELIERLHPGEQIIITRDQKPVARLIGEMGLEAHPPRRLGTLKGTVRYMSADFDAPLDDFKEYMD